MLVGGANGAGCTTDETTLLEHQVCHPRLFPSGTDTINWTRNAAGAGPGFGAATSTVMVVQWGSAWSVQRVRITGTAGGNGVNATTEYNTAGISPVARAQTWVWGTGHTSEPQTGNSAEGVVLTLGDGVNQNATESQLAAGFDQGGPLPLATLDFEVYALTHAQLVVDHRFVAQGSGFAGTSPVNVTVNAAGANRFALAYNSLDAQDDLFPTPMSYARYGTDTNVELLRRRTGPDFAAWVQGIDFSQIQRSARVCANTAATCYEPTPNAPSNVIVGSGPGANGITLAAGETLTFTYAVTVDSPLSAAIT
jgi:hypothetical protein